MILWPSGWYGSGEPHAELKGSVLEEVPWYEGRATVARAPPMRAFGVRAEGADLVSVLLSLPHHGPLEWPPPAPPAAPVAQPAWRGLAWPALLAALALATVAGCAACCRRRRGREPRLGRPLLST